MYAGETQYKVGQRVRLKNLHGEDAPLNGITGTVTHPFAFGSTGPKWLGFRPDNGTETPYGESFNVRTSEVEPI